ncbi:hypothetical protein [Neoroseomonas rubea]|uniref:hypothetical protein n=1 Tax=Neoroseomonas rubea TaxID=2748666 RepID=UPI0018DF7535|nr:hypothetical protein [Roseomonas rubea]
MNAFLVVMLGAGLLAWPAVLNGYPLVFIDSVSYLGQTLFPEWPWDKTPAYGAALHLFHWGVSLWPALGAQVLMVSHLLWMAQRGARGDATPGMHLLLCAALAAGTAAPWFASTLMPDIMAAVAPLCLLLLGFARDRFSMAEAVWMTLLGAVAIASHLSHLPTALALVVFVALATRRILPIARAALPVGLAVFGLLAANSWGTGRPALSPHGAVFLLARLQADGPAAATLRAHCPRAGWELCAFARDLPMDSDAFLWDARSPLNRATDGRPLAMGGMRRSAEAAEIVARTISERPAEVADAMARNALRQALLFEVGDTLDNTHLAASARRAIDRLPAGERATFDAGMQMRGELREAAAPFLQPHRLVILAALPLALFALGLALWRRDWVRAGLIGGALVAVAANAVATGALSAPVDRYQARIVWLVPLVALLGLMPRFGAGLIDDARIRARMSAWRTSSSSSPSS